MWSSVSWSLPGAKRKGDSPCVLRGVRAGDPGGSSFYGGARSLQGHGPHWGRPLEGPAVSSQTRRAGGASAVGEPNASVPQKRKLRPLRIGGGSSVQRRHQSLAPNHHHDKACPLLVPGADASDSPGLDALICE